MSHRRRRPPRRPVEKKEWFPNTRLGHLVKDGDISSIEEIFQQYRRIAEPEIVDTLMPNLDEEVVNISLVQRSRSVLHKLLAPGSVNKPMQGENRDLNQW